MKEHEVPQDSEGSLYGGARKLIYAMDDDGDFVGVKSAGWDAESDATQVALTLMQQQCEDSWQRATSGQTAPLEYYMYFRRMDVALLAQATGFFQWRIRRHFRPALYAGLNEKRLARYAQALEFSTDALRQLPEQPLHDRI